MNRTISSYLDQRSLEIVKNLQVRRFRARVLEVLFPGHSLVVAAAGYSGPSEVPADISIAFGTIARPLIFRGTEVWIEMDETGKWRAVSLASDKSRCFPTTDPNAPNVPLPTYTPPIDSSQFNFGNLNPVDMSFPPFSIPMGQFAVSKLPSSTSNVYDIGDGYNGTIAANATKKLLAFATVRRFKINRISAYCPEDDLTIRIFATNGTHANIWIWRLAGSWSVYVKNTTTGANIYSSENVSSADGFSTTLTGLGIVTVPTAGTFFNCNVLAYATPLTKVGYGIGGYLY